MRRSTGTGSHHLGSLHAPGVLLAFLLAVGACEGGSRAVPESGSAEARGERLFSRHCSSCHSTSPNTVIVGPSLAGLADRAGERVEGMDARTYLENSILAPNDYVVEGFRDVMPEGFEEILTPEDLRALIDYLVTVN